MKQIEIVFTKSKLKLPFGSWLIRLWTNKPYSHVARSVQVKDWAKLYYQSSEGKVNYEVDEVFHSKHIIVKRYSIAVPEILDQIIKRECILDSGKPYGLMQNLGIAIVNILGKIGIKATNPWKEGRNCSELIYENVFKLMYPDLNHNKDTIVPHQIEQIILDKFELHSGVWIPKQEKQNGNS